MRIFKQLCILKKALTPKFKKIYANELNKKINNFERDDIFVSPFFMVEATVLSAHVRLYGRGKIANSSVGEYTYIHSDTTIAYAEIGKFCSIAQNNIIAQGEHPVNFISTHPLFYSKNAPWKNKFSDREIVQEHSKVVIGNDVWVGAGCYIKDGINIGNGSIIASGSVVVKDVPDFAIVGGIPAKLIKYRFSEEIITQLLDLKWWDYDIDILKKYKNYFQQKTTDEQIKTFISKLKNSNIKLEKK
ncbi:MAG: CatB-related O-acetyltransferase [Bacteroidales bacterium]|nr:CatB-related O-acetyltransferase [Bacteroidales bacterium]